MCWGNRFASYSGKGRVVKKYHVARARERLPDSEVAIPDDSTRTSQNSDHGDIDLNDPSSSSSSAPKEKLAHRMCANQILNNASLLRTHLLSFL